VFSSAGVYHFHLLAVHFLVPRMSHPTEVKVNTTDTILSHAGGEDHIRKEHKTKVTIVGAGQVGMAIAFAILNKVKLNLRLILPPNHLLIKYSQFMISSFYSILRGSS